MDAASCRVAAAGSRCHFFAGFRGTCKIRVPNKASCTDPPQTLIKSQPVCTGSCTNANNVRFCKSLFRQNISKQALKHEFGEVWQSRVGTPSLSTREVNSRVSRPAFGGCGTSLCTKSCGEKLSGYHTAQKEGALADSQHKARFLTFVRNDK